MVSPYLEYVRLKVALWQLWHPRCRRLVQLLNILLDEWRQFKIIGLTHFPVAMRVYKQVGFSLDYASGFCRSFSMISSTKHYASLLRNKYKHRLVWQPKRIFIKFLPHYPKRHTAVISHKTYLDIVSDLQRVSKWEQIILCILARS